MWSLHSNWRRQTRDLCSGYTTHIHQFRILDKQLHFFYTSVLILFETLIPGNFARVIGSLPLPPPTPSPPPPRRDAVSPAGTPRCLSLHAVSSLSVAVLLLRQLRSCPRRRLWSSFSATLEAVEVILLPVSPAKMQQSQGGSPPASFLLGTLRPLPVSV